MEMEPTLKLLDINRRQQKAYNVWGRLRAGDRKGVPILWLREKIGFQNFLEDVKYPPSMDCRFEKIDRRLPYSKENCHWVPTTGKNNQKYFVTHQGKNMPIVDAAMFLGIEPRSLSIKLARWSKSKGRNTFTLEELS